MAHPRFAAEVDLPGWKNGAALVCAVLLAALFLIAGLWKTTDPYGAAARLAQAKVPGDVSIPGAVVLGSIEVFAAILLLMPGFRRWGALLIAAMLVFFMGYVGFFYNDLRGEECSCFPLIKRAVGPQFFAGDMLMLLAAVVAGWWARRPENMRTAAMILGGVAVFAAASFGVAMTQNSGRQAPDYITVDGKKTALSLGKVMLFFYDPECLHCDEAAKVMSKHNWKDSKVVAIPTRMPQFAAEFLKSTKLKAGTSNDLEILKKTFPFGDPPYGVALENGRQKAALPIFDKKEPEASLRRLGFIE